ncbi:MAG: hypothetical protein AB7F74_16230 [Parvibaculaceae bacterium]
MFTKALVAAAALTASVVMTAPAQAKDHFNVNIGLGGYYGGGYYPGYYPVYGGYDYDSGISCGKAKKIVKNHGFYNVYATDCGGKIMRFKGQKYGEPYRIKIDRWGHIVDVDHL